MCAPERGEVGEEDFLNSGNLHVITNARVHVPVASDGNEDLSTGDWGMENPCCKVVMDVTDSVLVFCAK